MIRNDKLLALIGGIWLAAAASAGPLTKQASFTVAPRGAESIGVRLEPGENIWCQIVFNRRVSDMDLAVDLYGPGTVRSRVVLTCG